ncbi:MAG: DEAD/DEAH box helicase [Candidatus Micrarchaeota archaeon]
MGDSLFKSGAPVPRDYQRAIAAKALERNTLVVLPTGLGKTLIAALVLQDSLKRGERVVVLAPTKPLAEQHMKTLLEIMELEQEEITLITGGTVAEKRTVLWENARVALATPQTLENDLKRKRMRLDGVGLVVFDEAHRCVGKYAYSHIAGECKKKGVRILGLTASPGSNEQKIRKIMETLGIEAVEVRGEEDEDVRGYMQPRSTRWVEVDLPPSIISLRLEMEGIITEKATMFERLGLLGRTRALSKKKLMAIRKMIDNASGGWKYSALSRYAELFNLVHAHELLETQGIGTFLEFFKRMEGRKTKSKAVQRILNDKRVLGLIERAKDIQTEHPKLIKLVEIIGELQGKTIIVFVQYRDQVMRVADALGKLDGIRPVKFVGKGKGVSQKDQKRTIEHFRNGDYNVLVATQIGEEGLDIPSVDCVIFYEPVPSEIRSIQRRGRTGRTRAGEVVVLITRGTRDETYYWVSRRKEKRMKNIINRMQKTPVKRRGRNIQAVGKDKKQQMSIVDYV